MLRSYSFIALLIILSLFSLSTYANTYVDDSGLITKKSKYTVSQTLDKLETLLKQKGIIIVVRWNHAEKAKAVDIAVRPTELLIFGNPKMGSHLFTSNQTAAIDLPLKALAWQDEKGNVFLSYNDPAYIAKRHNITDRDKIFNKMSAVLNKLSDIATGNN